MPRPSSALVLLPPSFNERQETARSSPIFNYFSHIHYFDIMRNRIDIPFALPQHNRNRAMSHAEYIANTLRKYIQEYRNQSFDNFGVEVRIYPVPSAFELYDSKGRWIGFNQYVFDAFDAEPKAMHVTLDHKWNVKIKYLGAWRPISAYLKNIQPPNALGDSMSKNDIMHLQWRRQADWWKENGKVFPLMKLPAEIREIIFGHVWGPAIEPYPTSSARKLTKLGKIARRLRMPNSNILRANAQIAAEASNILFMRTSFVVEHYGVLKALTCNVEQRNLIRHLELAFSHDDFMHFFSTDHIRKDKKTKTAVVGFGYPALALRNMKLSSLRIVIAPPSFVTKSGMFDGACQRVVVDIIMETAWPVIRGQPLGLIGHIKEAQKEIYQARDVLERKRVQAWQKSRAAWGLAEGSLAEYDEEIDEEVGGVPLDGSRPEIAPEETPVMQYDLVCYCDPPCREETWLPRE